MKLPNHPPSIATGTPKVSRTPRGSATSPRRAPTLASSSSLEEARLPATSRDDPLHSHTAAQPQPAFLETPKFATGNSRPSKFGAKTLLLPGGVFGKGDLSSQAAITKTLLPPGPLLTPPPVPQLQHHPAEDSRARPPCPSSLRLQPLPTPLLPKAQIFGAGMSKGKFTRKGRLLSYLEAKYTRVMVAEALHLKRFSMYKAEFSWRGMYRLRSTGGVCPGPLSSANFVTL